MGTGKLIFPGSEMTIRPGIFCVSPNMFIQKGSFMRQLRSWIGPYLSFVLSFISPFAHRTNRCWMFIIIGLTASCTAMPDAENARDQLAKNQQAYLDRIKNGDQFSEITVTYDDPFFEARDGVTGQTLLMAKDPVRVAHWAMTMADVTYLKDGRYEFGRTLEVPRSNVTLIIGKDVIVRPADNARLTRISEGHGTYRTMIRVTKRNHVRIINLGTIVSPDIGVLFDGRNAGKVGIQNGTVFSTGPLKCSEGFWIVDTANFHVPVLIGNQELQNAPLVLEGNENAKLGFIAGLLGKSNREGETVDLNSFNKQTKIDTILTWTPTGTRDEVLDVNNSPGTKTNRVISYGSKEKTQMTTIATYGMNGRRLTQKPYIDHSQGTETKSEMMRPGPVQEWKRSVEIPGFPRQLPVMTINVSLTAIFEDGSEEEVFSRNVRFNLDPSP